MRTPTLDERICFKGCLEKKGLDSLGHVREFPEFIHFWKMCFGQTIAHHNKLAKTLQRKQHKFIK